MTDNRFPGGGADNRFPGDGSDARFPGGGVDNRFPGGVDNRFGGSGYGRSYALNSFDPELVADFPNAYHRSGGAPTTFADLFTHNRVSTGVYFDSNGHMKTAAIGEARVLDHVFNGTSWVPAGMLMEEAATNLLTVSDPSTWSVGNAATTANAAIGPDGQMSMAKLADNDDSGTGAVRITRSLNPVEVSTVYCASFYARKDQLNWCTFYTYGFTTPAGVHTYFDLENGVVGTVNHDAAGIIDLGGGLYRCWVRMTTDAVDTSGNFRIYLANSNGNTSVARDGTSSVFVSHCQFEKGYYPSSFIETTGSTVTRADDTLEIDGTGSPWGAGDAFSYAIEGDLTYVDDESTSTAAILNHRKDGNNLITWSLDTIGGKTGKQYASNRFNATTFKDYGPNEILPGQHVPFKWAGRYNGTAIQLASNGATDTEGAHTQVLPATLKTSPLVLGGKMNGHIKLLRVTTADIGEAGILEGVS